MNFWNQSSTLTKVVIVALLLAVVCACAGVSGFFFFNIFSSESQGPVIGGDEGGSGSTGGIIIVIPTPAPGVPSVTATANLNIRSGPSTEYPKVGLLQEGQTAEAIGVSPDGAWWVIKVPEAANGQGWVSGQFVTTANVENLPVVQPPPLPPATPAPPVVITEWQGEYFDNNNLSGQPALVRNDPEINFNWGTGAPAPEVTPGNFSARWTISRELPAGTYRFSVWVSDGVRLWVDNNQLLNGWQQGPVRNYVVEAELAAGAHTVRVEYFQATGPAVIQLDLGYTAPSGEPQGPQAVINGTTQAAVGQTVNFNARNSAVAEGSHLTTFEWTFGDGTGASGVDVSHVYDQPGRYDVTLTVTDDKNLSDTAVQQIRIEGEAPPEPGEPPLAVINAPAQGEVGQSVTFDASASDSANPIVSYEWNLGDGSTANAVTINHIYRTPGVYNVILTLTDDQGLQGTANHQIQISEAPPEPTEEPPPEPSVPPTGVINAPAQAAAGQEVTFDGAASQPGDGGAITAYLWDFGDGTDPASGPTVTHIYPDAGQYTVTLTVTDESEQSGQAQATIVVDADPGFGVEPNQAEGNGEGQQEGQ